MHRKWEKKGKFPEQRGMLGGFKIMQQFFHFSIDSYQLLKNIKKTDRITPAKITGIEIRRMLKPDVLNAVISLFLARSPIENIAARSAATGNIIDSQPGKE